MAKRTVVLVVGVVLVAVVAVAGALLLLRDDSPGEAANPGIRLSRERESLGMFRQEEAIERAGEMVGFDIRLPSELPESMQLTSVQAHTGAAPIGVRPRYATLWYDVELPGSDEPAKVSVQQYAEAVEMNVGDEWETETLTVGSMMVTLHSKTEDLAVAIFVARIPETPEGFNVIAPLALKEQALDLTRAFVEAYEADQ